MTTLETIEAKLTTKELIEIRAILFVSENAFWSLTKADPKNAPSHKKEIERIREAKKMLTNAILRDYEKNN